MLTFTPQVIQPAELYLPGRPAERNETGVAPHLRPALRLLLQAYDYAQELKQDTWDMAVELEVLREAKLTNSDLRWLDAKNYVEHAVELTTRDDDKRRFHRTPLPSFTDRVCAILTPRGVEMARNVCSSEFSAELETARADAALTSATDESLVRPKWDHQRRQLRMGTQLVKEFKLPSPNQETVLMAFEEEGWPPRVDDPLPPVAMLDPRRRLHDTIKALNRKQKQRLIRFRGDGSGEGIRWEPVVPE